MIFSENRFPLFRIGLYVTQRPGSSRLAISVNTLTTGSHATVIFRSPGFRSPDRFTSGAEGALRASRATGMRTTTEVSARPYNRTETGTIGFGCAIDKGFGCCCRTRHRPREIAARRELDGATHATHQRNGDRSENSPG